MEIGKKKKEKEIYTHLRICISILNEILYTPSIIIYPGISKEKIVISSEILCLKTELYLEVWFSCIINVEKGEFIGNLVILP